MFAALPVELDDPLERVRRRRAVDDRRARRCTKRSAASTLAGLGRARRAGAVLARDALLHAAADRASGSGRSINLVVSNVPGPPLPLYLAGARLVAIHPLGPIFDDCGLNLTVISYLDHIDFGFIACRELVPDVDDLAAAVPEALAELMKAAGV